MTDGLEIDPSAVSISVGDSVNIEVKTTNSKNPIYWDIVDSEGNSIIGDAETCIKFSTAPENKSLIRVTVLRRVLHMLRPHSR
ncbi:MAG: hypothetical protein IKK96_01900 [Lachnospiraceae bacterium]|nr:hypothetical protein [Lachnospiraceae bacterium]